MELLERLLNEARGIAKLKPAPQGEVRKGDTIVGEVPESVRPLYCLWQKYERQAEESVLQLRFGDIEGDEKTSLEVHTSELRTKAEILRELFWASLRDALQLWNAERIRLCAGWKVVTPPSASACARSLTEMLSEAVFEAATGDGDCGNPDCPIHGPRVRERAEKAAAEGGS